MTNNAERAPPDLRAELLGLCGWACGLATLRLPLWCGLGLVMLAASTVVIRCRRRRPVTTVLAWLLAALAVAGVTALRVEANRSGVVARLASDDAAVTATGRVTTDPVLRDGRFGSYTIREHLARPEGLMCR